MTTTIGNRKILDLKRWEFCTPSPVATAAAMCVISSRHARRRQLFMTSATVHYLYDPNEDGWIQIPSGAFGGTFGAGTCGVATAVGPSGTATAGTTTTLTTNLTIQRDLRGYSIHITSGPGAGDTRTIASNTIGANAVITVTSAFSGTITSSSTYRLLTPRWYVLNAVGASGTTTTALFRFYDFALNTWTNAETGATDGVAPAAVIGTDGRLISTPSWLDSGYKAFGGGTATSATGTTLSDSGKSWTASQWINYQVRIVSGTGAGQIRTITANTGTQLTVATWTINPDATSVYTIEGNDDFIYYMGSNAVTLYRYSISGGTWTTLSPGVARAAAPSTGMSAHWVWDAEDPAWTNESAILNGRYIYSFRGGGSTVLDRYDIAANTWTNAIPYAPATETFTTGTSYCYHGSYLYIQKEATGRWFRYNFVTSEMDPWNTMMYTQGAAVLGDKAWDVLYTDGATEIVYIYCLLNTSTVLLRQMVI
jgi:hypothetical protein